MSVARGPNDVNLYNALARMCHDFARATSPALTLRHDWELQAIRFSQMARASYIAYVDDRRRNSKGRRNV